MTTMSFSDLWKYFKFLSDPNTLSQEHKSFLQSFLPQEVRLREEKRIQFLLRSSGIKRIKRLIDFDWTFNPKIPKDKIMESLHTQWLTKPANLLLVGPAGVGKTHIASALCHEAILTGHQTAFLTLFDLTAKLAKAKNLYSLIEHYARAPILCIDELGYILPSREEADWIFQILSKRAEVTSTIVTTNLTPSNWGKVFDSVTASAILDRLSMNGKFITLEGRSYRSKK